MEGLRRMEERRSRDIRWMAVGSLDDILGVFFGEKAGLGGRGGGCGSSGEGFLELWMDGIYY